MKSDELMSGDMSSDGPQNSNVTAMSRALPPRCLCSSHAIIRSSRSQRIARSLKSGMIVGESRMVCLESLMLASKSVFLCSQSVVITFKGAMAKLEL